MFLFRLLLLLFLFVIVVVRRNTRDGTAARGATVGVAGHARCARATCVGGTEIMKWRASVSESKGIMNARR